MKLIIDRTKWYRGWPTGARLLRPEDGKMCCLGFYGLACGLTEEEIRDQGEPKEVHSDKWPASCVHSEAMEDEPESEIVYENTSWTVRAININDDDGPESVREDALVRHFAKVDVEVEFVG